jgi:DNA-binding CsgD family transcriptional regulator
MSSAAAGLSNRLRVAVLASDAGVEGRLAALVAQFGHELVEAGASPDACLTDGTAFVALSAPVVALGAAVEDFAGILPPDASPIQIDAALQAVVVGLTVRPAQRPHHGFAPMTEETAVVLTPREIEVLAALGKGLSNKAVARQLGISPHTVKFHVESLFRKLGAGSRAEAVVKGLKQQICEF